MDDVRKLHRAELETVIREGSTRASPEGNLPVDEDVGHTFGCKFSGSDRKHVHAAANKVYLVGVNPGA